MSVRVIPWKPDRLKNKWMGDIRSRKPDGTEDVAIVGVYDAPTRSQARSLVHARGSRVLAKRSNLPLD